MKYELTPATIEILTNFCKINPTVILTPGVAQRTVNMPGRNFVADVELEQPIPVQCAIYDLTKLISVLQTVTSKDNMPSLVFNEESLTVQHQYGSVTIPFTHPELVTKPPTAKLYIEETIASFTLPQTLWGVIQKQASVLESDSLQIVVSEQGEFSLRLYKSKVADATAVASATFTVPDLVLGSTEPNTWAITFNSLALIPGNYSVTVGMLTSDSLKAKGGSPVFGAVFALNDPAKRVTYTTTGTVVRSR